MSNDRAQPGSRNTHHGNSPPDPPPPDALHKQEMSIRGTKFMVWNLNFQVQVKKAKAFSTDDVAAAMQEIDAALDLCYSDQYFLVNPQSNNIHGHNTVPPANSFIMEEYVTSTIPMKESTKLDIKFKIASCLPSKWHYYLPVNKLNDLSGNVKGSISIDDFCGKSSKLLGIITEVDIGIFPRDKIRKDMEDEYEEVFQSKTTIRLRTSILRSRITSKQQKVIFIYGDEEKKSTDTGFITAYVLKGGLKKFGMMKGLFTPSRNIMGPENAETKESILSAHASFIEQHQVINLHRVEVADLQVRATKEDRMEVLEDKTTVIKLSDSNSTLLDLLYAFFNKNKASPVGLGTFTDSIGSTVFFVHTHKSKVNNVYETLHSLNHATFRDTFFLQPFYESLPSEAITYLSMGKDKSSRKEIFHKDSNRRFNIQKEFPALPTKPKSNQAIKPSTTPSHQAQPKAKPTTSFVHKAKFQSKQSSTPRANNQQQKDPAIAALQAENAALKRQVSHLSADKAEQAAEITSLRSKLAQRDNNIQALNKSVDGISQVLNKFITNQPKSKGRDKLTKQFQEHVAPHVETCQEFEVEEDPMETQEEEDDFTEPASTNPE